MTRTTISTTNWWDNLRQGLVWALAPFLLACESDDFLSLPPDPGQLDLVPFSARIPIPFAIVRQDSINTSASVFSSSDNRKRLLSGQQTTDLGVAEATSYVDFAVGPRTPVGDTARYESLVLELVYERSYGTEQSANQSLEIRPLTEVFDDSTAVYYNSDALPTSPNPLGTATVTTKLTGEPDTLRFRLSDALGQDVFNRAQARDSTVLSDAEFLDFFPGLALVPTAGNNFVASFEPTGTRMIMSFTDADNEVREHTFTVRRYFNRVTGNYAGTPLAELDVTEGETVPTDGNFYLQSGTGVSPVIRMDSVLEFISRQSSDTRSVLLNRVDLNIGLSAINDTLAAPPALFAYELVEDSLGQLVRIPRQGNRGQVTGYQGLSSDLSRTLFEASPIPLVDTRYQLPITNYVNVLLSNDTLSQELYVRANDFNSSLTQLSTVPDSVYADVYYTILE